MNLTNPTEIWQEILSVFKKENPSLSGETAEIWLEPIKAISFTDNLLIIEVPNRFFQDWFTQYTPRLEEILRQISSTQSTIAYNVKSPEPSQEQEKVPEIPAPEPESSFADFELNPKYTFETFVVGPSNRFAQAAAEAVAKDPAKAYNPLFIYGGVGLGKTHLLQAVGHYIRKTKPNLRILYITSEKFINEFINSLQTKKSDWFRSKYRNLDILLIDDIQFLGGKGSSQEEFFHTFNTLYDSRKQIVVSGDRAPKEIPAFQERLVSRFEWGLIASIEPPDIETRIAILRKKAEAEALPVPDDVILFIANHIKSNIRQLEGALIRVVAFSSLIGGRISVDLTEDILKDVLPKSENKKAINIELVQKVVAQHFNIEVEDLLSRKRPNSIAFPRQVAMYLCRELTEFSFPDIGSSFGGKDHSTVIHAYEKIKYKAKEDPYFNALLNKIINNIQSTE